MLHSSTFSASVWDVWVVLQEPADSRPSYQLSALGSQPLPWLWPCQTDWPLKGTPITPHHPGRTPVQKTHPSNSSATLSPRPLPTPQICVILLWVMPCGWQLLARVTASMSPSPLQEPITATAAALAPGFQILQAAAVAVAAATALSRRLTFNKCPFPRPEATQTHLPLFLSPSFLNQALPPVILEMA